MKSCAHDLAATRCTPPGRGYVRSPHLARSTTSHDGWIDSAELSARESSAVDVAGVGGNGESRLTSMWGAPLHWSELSSDARFAVGQCAAAHAPPI